jgi:prevent-host-death family protein
MEVTTKELRIQPGKILDQVSIGQEVTVTYRGKPLARIVPFRNEEDIGGDSMFGLWKDHESDRSVEELVREARKGRAF